MKRIIALLLSIFLVVTFTACSGSDKEDTKSEQTKSKKVEETVEIEEDLEEPLEQEDTVEVEEDSVVAREPLISREDDYTMLQSLFINLYRNQGYDEVKEIALSCDFAVEENTTSKGVEQLIIYNKDEGFEDSDILVVAFDDDMKLDTAKYNIEANRWFVELTYKETYAVNHPGTFLDEREEAFGEGQAVKALEYALGLTDAYQGS